MMVTSKGLVKQYNVRSSRATNIDNVVNIITIGLPVAEGAYI